MSEHVERLLWCNLGFCVACIIIMTITWLWAHTAKQKLQKQYGEFAQKEMRLQTKIGIMMIVGIASMGFAMYMTTYVLMTTGETP